MSWKVEGEKTRWWKTQYDKMTRNEKLEIDFRLFMVFIKDQNNEWQCKNKLTELKFIN